MHKKEDILPSQLLGKQSQIGILLAAALARLRNDVPAAP